MSKAETVEIEFQQTIPFHLGGMWLWEVVHISAICPHQCQLKLLSQLIPQAFICSLGINFQQVLKPILTSFTNSDWGADKNDRKSIAGYGFYFGICLISWNSKKQASVALSSYKAKYITLVHVAKEMLWLRALLKYLGLS